MECDKCGTDVDEGTEFECPECGAQTCGEDYDESRDLCVDCVTEADEEEEDDTE